MPLSKSYMAVSCSGQFGTASQEKSSRLKTKINCSCANLTGRGEVYILPRYPRIRFYAQHVLLAICAFAKEEGRAAGMFNSPPGE